MYKKKKYILQIIIIIITSFLVFNVFFFINIRESNKTNFYEVGNNITIETSNVLKSWVEDQIKVVKMIAMEQKIIDLCRFPENKEVVDKGQEFLCHIHKLYPYYENLPVSVKLNKAIKRNIDGSEVLINNGQFLVDTVGGKTVGKGGMNYSYIDEIFKGKEYFISEIYPSILRENPIFVISAPIKYKDEIIGVAIISPQIDYFTKTFVDKVKFKNTGYLFFIDDRGTTIAHPNRSFILSTSNKPKAIGQELLKRFSKGDYYFEANIYESTKYYIGNKVDLNGQNIKHHWYIIFTETKSEVLKNSNKFLLILLIMIIIATIIVAWAVYLVSKINQKELYESELKKINETLEGKVEERTRVLKKLAVTDGLTNLLNHQATYNRLVEEINKAKEKNGSLSIIMADLDHFKRVNDKYGHQVGDEVIANTSKAILSNIKTSDTAGRYGGEEFLIVLTNLNENEAVEVADKIKNDVANMEFLHRGLKVTISMGLCTWNGESSIELVNKADKLLYKAKQNGRNRVEAE